MAKFQKKSAYITDEVVPVVEAPVDAAPSYVITDDDLLSPALQQEEAQTLHTISAAMPPSGGVMMTAADIAAIVQAAVAGAQQAGNTGIAEQIAAGVSKALTGHMGVRPKTVAEIGEPKTPFNPTGKKRELECEFFQQGAPINERLLHDSEIEMLHQLVPGSYGPPDFPIAVVKKIRASGGKPRVYIIYGGSKDDRMREKNYGTNFYAFCARLVQESKEQLAKRKAEARAFLADE